MVYSVLTALSARQLLDTGVKPFGPLVHTPSSEQQTAAEQHDNVQVNGQTAVHSDSTAVSDERKEDVSSKQERKKKR